jgi:hypothetical protein
MNKAIDIREDILRERIHDVAHNLLISHNPDIIGRVGNLNFFLLTIFTINELGRRADA